jgi:cytochrome b
MLAGRHEATLGHNPLGGWSVLAMLLSLAVQAATGLFANDDILTEGPLAARVSKATSDLLSTVHAVNSNVLYALIALHLSAVAFYLVIQRENLVWPMITGYKPGTPGSPADAAEPAFASPLRALALIVVMAAVVWGLVSG